METPAFVGKKRAYIALPIQGSRLSSQIYERLCLTIKEIGIVISNPQVFVPPTKDAGLYYDAKSIYQENYSMLKSSDLLIAEISTPSLGVGYEIATAERLELPILCIYQSKLKRPVSLMILGMRYSKIQFNEYQDGVDLKTKLINAICAS